MTKHNRREEYWRFYDHAVVAEAGHLRRTLIRLIRESPCPRSEGSSRGRPPIHSKEKLDFACLWMMMAYNQTYRVTESDLEEIRTIFWDGEPVPDHTTPVKHMQTLPYEWMDRILVPGRPPLPGRGWRGDRPAGRRQQRDGDHQVRGGRTSRQEGTRLYG